LSKRGGRGGEGFDGLRPGEDEGGSVGGRGRGVHRGYRIRE